MDKTTLYIGVVLMVCVAMLCCAISYGFELEATTKRMEIQSHHILTATGKRPVSVNAQ